MFHLDTDPGEVRWIDWDLDQPYDRSFKLSSDDDPRGLLDLLDILPLTVEAEVHSIAREQIFSLSVDHAYDVETGGSRRIEHIEAQAQWTSAIPERVFMYQVALWHKQRTPVRTTIVLLARDSSFTQQEFELHAGDLYGRSRFRLVKLWELDSRKALIPNHPVLWTLVPLMNSGATEIREAADRIASLRDPRLRVDMIDRIRKITGLRYDKDETVRLLSRLLMLIPDEMMAQSSVLAPYREEWEKKGIEKGRLDSYREFVRQLAGRFPEVPIPDLSKVDSGDLLNSAVSELVNARTADEVRTILSTLR